MNKTPIVFGTLLIVGALTLSAQTDAADWVALAAALAGVGLVIYGFRGRL